MIFSSQAYSSAALSLVIKKVYDKQWIKMKSEINWDQCKKVGLDKVLIKNESGI